MSEKVRFINGTYLEEKTGTVLLEKMDGTFEAGRTYWVLGDSKSASSLFTSVVAGLEPLTSGELRVAGKNALAFTAGEVQSKVSAVFQRNNYLEDLSSLENLYYFLHAIEQSKKKKDCLGYLAGFGITEAAAKKPLKKTEPFLQKKYCLAKALVMKPEVLVLDNLLSDLDIYKQEQLMSFLNQLAKEENMCVIILTNEQFSGRYADEVWGLNQGKLTFIK